MGFNVEKSKMHAFTLLELLVVIAVLALLMAVILPALNSAKLSAKQVVCAAKMRQWTLAELAYIEENDYTVTPYADVCDMYNGGNALNPQTYYHSRLSPYLMDEDYGRWGMGNIRRCPMGKTAKGDQSVWIGVYYGFYNTEWAPFVFLNEWDGSAIIKKSQPFKSSVIKTPSNYLMVLDVRRDHVFSFFHKPWDFDFDGDQMNDSNSGILSTSIAAPYNFAQPKIHRGGCNVGLFDGHVEWIKYEDFWAIGSDGYPIHPYWYNKNHP